MRDPTLADVPLEVFKKFLHVAHSCVKDQGKQRPDMDNVILDLEDVRPAFFGDVKTRVEWDKRADMPSSDAHLGNLLGLSRPSTSLHPGSGTLPLEEDSLFSAPMTSNPTGR